MSRRRYISTSMSIDKRLNLLAIQHGDFAALLYTWMIPHAADDTTLNGDIDEFMATVIPMRRDKSAEEVIAALDGMADLGLIVWDKGAAQIRFPAPAFYAHQTFIRKDNRVEDWEIPQNAAEHREAPQNTASLSLSITPSVSVSAAPAPAAKAANPRPSSKKPEIKLLTDDQRTRIREDFPDIPDLMEEIDFALAHDAHKKCSDENLYLRHWLRESRARLPVGVARRNGQSGATGERQTARQGWTEDDPMYIGTKHNFPPGFKL